MILPTHLAWVNVVFSGHPGWEDFVMRDLLPEYVKALIEALDSIHNDQLNLRDNNPYKYFVLFNERPWDEVVKEMILFFLLSNDIVREAMLAYFNALSEWKTCLEASHVEVEEWNRISDALQKKVNEAHAALDQTVAEALRPQLIQECLSTVKDIVDDAESARKASLTLHSDALTDAMDRHRETRDTLIQRLQCQLDAIDEAIIAENSVQP